MDTSSQAILCNCGRGFKYRSQLSRHIKDQTKDNAESTCKSTATLGRRSRLTNISKRENYLNRQDMEQLGLDAF
jgi:ribosomal protein S15P/S13E